jgi:hypothetical protein
MEPWSRGAMSRERLLVAMELLVTKGARESSLGCDLGSTIEEYIP